MWGREGEGAKVFAPPSAGFQSLPPVPTIKLVPSGFDSWVVGLVHTLGPCGFLQQNLLWGWEFLPLPPQPPRVFLIRGLRLYFPVLELWVVRSVLLPCCSSGFILSKCGALGSASHHLVGSASCSLACPVPQSTTLLRPPAATLPQVLYTWLPVSTPPTSLDECFFFISLVVGLPYSRIFCQFWSFFVFKLLLSFFWLCEEAQCVYLCLHLGQEL